MKIQNRFKIHQSLRAHCKKQTQNICEICSHEFCTATQLNAHQMQQGCEGQIEFSSNVLGTKAILVDSNSEHYETAAMVKKPSVDHLQISTRDDKNTSVRLCNGDMRELKLTRNSQSRIGMCVKNAVSILHRNDHCCNMEQYIPMSARLNVGYAINCKRT